MSSVGRPFLPGVSGNPGGRPKSPNRLIREAVSDDDLVKILRMQRDLALGRIPTKIDENGEEVPIAITKLEAKDITKAAEFVRDTLIGKPRQVIEGDVTMGLSAGHVALLAALQLTPHEREKRLAQMDQEDAAAIAAHVQPD